ncbi:hypothetical protein [Streptomyces sp. NPDC020917]|uniref:hypothetical protein n=1 Tax=Streptomyces sp. NPDC020917 TaxID=3365102 RepID=UPI0037B57202
MSDQRSEVMAREQWWRSEGLFALCVLVALGAALVCVFGLVAMYQHGTGAYAVRYGRSVVLELPEECTEGGNGASCQTKWTRQDATLTRQDGRTGSVPFLPGQAITVHFSDAGWSQYDHYYAYREFGLGGYERGGKDDPTDVTLAARAFGHDAYVAIGYHSTSLTSWGRHRLPPTVWWSLPLGLLPLVVVGAALAVEAVRGPAGGPSPGPARPRGTPVASPSGTTSTARRVRPRPVSVSSTNARVAAEPEGLRVEERAVGLDGTTRWRTLLELEWHHIARVELVPEPSPAMNRLLRRLDLDIQQLDHHRLDALRASMRAGRMPAFVTVTLYVHHVRESKPRRLLDASWLGTDAWESVAAAVAANTTGRLALDLTPLASTR